MGILGWKCIVLPTLAVQLRSWMWLCYSGNHAVFYGIVQLQDIGVISLPYIQVTCWHRGTWRCKSKTLAPVSCKCHMQYGKWSLLYCIRILLVFRGTDGCIGPSKKWIFCILNIIYQVMTWHGSLCRNTTWDRSATHCEQYGTPV